MITAERLAGARTAWPRQRCPAAGRRSSRLLRPTVGKLGLVPSWCRSICCIAASVTTDPGSGAVTTARPTRRPRPICWPATPYSDSWSITSPASTVSKNGVDPARRVRQRLARPGRPPVDGEDLDRRQQRTAPVGHVGRRGGRDRGQRRGGHRGRRAARSARRPARDTAWTGRRPGRSSERSFHVVRAGRRAGRGHPCPARGRVSQTASYGARSARTARGPGVDARRPAAGPDGRLRGDRASSSTPGAGARRPHHGEVHPSRRGHRQGRARDVGRRKRMRRRPASRRRPQPPNSATASAGPVVKRGRVAHALEARPRRRRAPRPAGRHTAPSSRARG